MFTPQPTRRPVPGPILLSIMAHGVMAAVWLLGTRVHPVHVFTLPGTPAGSHIELSYLPGRAPGTPAAPRPRSAAPKIPALQTMPTVPQPAVTPAVPASNTPPSPAPDATTGSDSWGSGSIQIALTTFSPSPAPDLSTLPHGVQGDVVVDVTIDPSGKVADLAVLRTLGYGIESSVIGTLRTWTFRPATKDGSPIASVQELHFHYGPV